MMNLSTLKAAAGSTKSSKRIARGQGSGKGGTATKGHKGAQSRSGYSQKFGFEGGQNPLQRRLPKRGFKNPFKVEYTAYNLDKIAELVATYDMKEFSYEALKVMNLVSKTEKIKVLGRGELTTKVDMFVHAISEKAKQELEKLGCKVTILS
jgi:large subunit ribosomal protein L15